MSSKEKQVLSIIATIMLGIIIVFLISWTLRSLAKQITAPLRNTKPIPIPDSASLIASSKTIHPLQSKFVAGYVFLRASLIHSGESRVAAWFLLDSGTTSCLLTSDYAAQAGIVASGSTQLSSGHVSQVGTANVDGFVVASARRSNPSLQTSPQTITILDDESVIQSIVGGGTILKENYGGILGVPFLREFNVLIDYDREQLLASRMPIPSIRKPTAIVPLSLSNPNSGKPELTVAVTVNGQPAGNWILDLGSDSSIVTQAVANRLGLKGGPPYQQLSLSDASITSASAMVTLSLGPPQSTKRMNVDLPEAPIQALANYGGDMAADYLHLLSQIGISIQQGELYLFN